MRDLDFNIFIFKLFCRVNPGFYVKTSRKRCVTVVFFWHGSRGCGVRRGWNQIDKKRAMKQFYSMDLSSTTVAPLKSLMEFSFPNMSWNRRAKSNMVKPIVFSVALSSPISSFGRLGARQKGLSSFSQSHSPSTSWLLVAQWVMLKYSVLEKYLFRNIPP